MNMMISYQELVRTFLNSLQPTIFMTTIRQVVVIKLFGARDSINTHFIFLKVNPNNPVSSQIIYYVMFYGTL